MKPPHRIPKIDLKDATIASGNDFVNPPYNVSQSSPNRFDSRLEKRKAEQPHSQTPVNGGNHSKVKKLKRGFEVTDG